MKKVSYLFSFILIIGLFVYYFSEQSGDKKIISNQTLEKKWKKLEKDKQNIKSRLENPSRKIAQQEILDHNKTEVLEEWEKSLAEKLFEFQSSDTKIYLKKKSEVKYKTSVGSKIYYQVEIVFNFQDKEDRSFHALVDPELGKIVETWDRSKHDEVRSKSLPLSPSGTF